MWKSRIGLYFYEELRSQRLSNAAFVFLTYPRHNVDLTLLARVWIVEVRPVPNTPIHRAEAGGNILLYSH
jgi:hypothetical protein